MWPWDECMCVHCTAKNIIYLCLQIWKNLSTNALWQSVMAYKLFLVHFSFSVQLLKLFGDVCWRQLCTNSLLIVSQVHTVCTLWKHDCIIRCYGLVRLYFTPIHTLKHINSIGAVFPYSFHLGHFVQTPNTIMSTAAWPQSGDRSDPN